MDPPKPLHALLRLHMCAWLPCHIADLARVKPNLSLSSCVLVHVLLKEGWHSAASRCRTLPEIIPSQKMTVKSAERRHQCVECLFHGLADLRDHIQSSRESRLDVAMRQLLIREFLSGVQLFAQQHGQSSDERWRLRLRPQWMSVAADPVACFISGLEANGRP